MSHLLKLKAKANLFVLSLFAMVFSTPAFAALSEAEQGVLDAIIAKVTDYTAPVLTVLAGVVGFFITLKWVKKIAFKVS